MTLGGLVVAGGVIAVSVATAGSAAPLAVAAGTSAASTIASTAAAAGGATAAATTAAGTSAAIAAGTVGGVATATSTAGALAAAAAPATAITAPSTIAASGIAGAEAGAIGGPAGVLLFCFDEDTAVLRKDGKYVAVRDLSVGDEVMSTSSLNDFPFVPTVAKVTNVTHINGQFPAHKLTFENGKSVTVTSPHLMIILKDGQMEMMAAKDIQLHDIMYFEGNQFSKITKIESKTLKKKINVETNSGLFFANGVLTTGMCENSPAIHNNANDVVMEYRATHAVY